MPFFTSLTIWIAVESGNSKLTWLDFADSRHFAIGKTPLKEVLKKGDYNECMDREDKYPILNGY